MSTFAGDVYVLHLLFVALQTSKKCPLLGCTLGVLTHTNARDQDWGGEKTLNPKQAKGGRNQDAACLDALPVW